MTSFLPRLAEAFSNRFSHQQAPPQSLVERAHASGDPFTTSPYFDEAEVRMYREREEIILPFLDRYGIDYSNVMDFAAGHGRNSAWLRERSGHIWIVDINQEVIDYCRQRFQNDHRFSYLRNDGVSLKGIPGASITFLFSFDAMVHFHTSVLRSYVLEFHRVLKKGGYGFCHHSNYSEHPDRDFKENPHWRSFMSKELFAQYLTDVGLEVVEQKVIDWRVPKLDCLSLFRRKR